MAWAAGISVPGDSRLNINSGQLHLELDQPGSLVIGGVIQTTTGTIRLNGDWTVTGVGYYDSGTGNVVFSSEALTQQITPGTVPTDSFYHLTHSSTADLRLVPDPDPMVIRDIDIRGNFYNFSGMFDANRVTMNLQGDWINAGSFVAHGNLVNLDGTDQQIYGNNTFYDLTKHVLTTSAYQLILESEKQQIVTHKLILRGDSSGPNLLALRASVPGTAALLKLESGGGQDIQYVDVWDNDASAGLVLIARSSPDHIDHALYNNTNWQFGSVSVAWDGSEDSDWDNPFNWDLGIVPQAGDTAVIPVDGTIYQPVLQQDLALGRLDIRAGASLTLNGHNATIDTTIYNAGMIVLNGTETVAASAMVDTGTFKYVGWPGGMMSNISITDDFVINGITKTQYHALILEEANPTVQADSFTLTADLTVETSATFTAGSLTFAAGKLLKVNGLAAINGAVVTARYGDLDLDGFLMSSGSLSAPSADNTFTVSGNFTHTGGTFTYNDGTVTLDGVNQTLKGDTGFYRLSKVMPDFGGSYTLTLWAGDTFTVHDRLTLRGFDQVPGDPDDPLRRLNIISSNGGAAANLRLLPGGVQDIRNVNVLDNHAGVDPTHLLLVGRGSSIGDRTTHWSFGPVSLKWDGSLSTAWAEPANWDLGVEPIAGDTVWLRYQNEDSGNQIILNQPILSGDVGVGALYVRDVQATLTLNGHGLAVPGVFSNDGMIYLQGGEALAITSPDVDSGTFVYYGDGSSTPFTITGGGRPTLFHNVAIQDPPSGTSSVFTVDTDLTIYGSLTVTGAGLNASAGSLDIGRDFVMTGGVFTAPGDGEQMAVFRHFTHTAGTFDANGGLVDLDGATSVPSTISEQVVTGSTTFYRLRKRIPSGIEVHRLVLDSAAVQTVMRSLELAGVSSGNLLELRSTSTADPVVQAGISLVPGATQDISYINVKDSNAGAVGSTGVPGVMLVARPSYFDGANNTNWAFGTASIRWTGAYSDYWGDPRNWDLGLVPVSGDDVTIANTANAPHLDYLPPNVPPAPVPPGAVAMRDLTLELDAVLYLDGYGLTVGRTMINNGSVSLQGIEPLSINTPDTANGTFIYTGTDPAAGITLNILGAGHTPLTYHNLVIAASAGNVFSPATDLVVNGDLTVSGGTLDVSTDPKMLSIGGATALTGGMLEARHTSVTMTGGMTLNGGTLSAPDAGHDFFVQGDWSNIAGSFLPYEGRVTFNGADDITISGNTSFYDLSLVSVDVDRTIYFAAGSEQTVTNDLQMSGTSDHKLRLRSTIDDSPWMLSVPNISPVVSNVDVRDSTAHVGANPRAYIFALNSVDQQNGAGTASSNTNWRFEALDILAPAPLRTVGPTPTVIGHAVPGEVVTLRDITGAVIATARADVNGSFRVVVGQDAADQHTVTKFALDVSTGTSDNVIIPYYEGLAGNSSVITVVAAPDAAQVPVIVSPPDGDRLVSDMPTITGQGRAGQSVEVVAMNAEGTMLLTIPPEAYAGTGTVGAGAGGIGTFSVTLTRALPRGWNYVSVIVDGVSSVIFTYIINDVHGQVFDSSSDEPLANVRVSMLRPDGTLAQPGVDIGPTDLNPFTTGADGYFAFLTASGGFKLIAEAEGYAFPTALTDDRLPAGHSIVVGSRGEAFVTSGEIRRIDLPVDASPYMFKVEKTANKKEAKVGEVVTYTVTIESLLSSNTIKQASLVDLIPPGFKFMNGRAQLEGAPVSDPTGNRPLWFSAGDFAPRQKKTLRYQLVIGSGVAPGSYTNTAVMKYLTGLVASNRAAETVTVTLDPLFDAGTVFGKVFYDYNENGRQDDPDYVHEERQEIIEGPVGQVRLVMEDGTIVTADANGQFHVPALLPGRHLLRLDERSLPPGAYMTTDKVQVVDVTPGSIIKVNFGVNIDNAQVVGRDVQFFQREILLDQSPAQPKPRLNIDVFNENILLHNDTVIEQIEFRMFTNYAPFFTSWQVDVIDSDTKKLVRSFKGTPYNIHDPVYWDGRDPAGRYLQAERHYAYVLKVRDAAGRWDETVERPLALKVLTDEEMSERQRVRSDQEKADAAAARAKGYRSFVAELASGSVLKVQNIWVKGDTVVLKPSTADVRQVRVLKKGELFTEVPVLERQGLTAGELLSGESREEVPPMEVILPDGDYELEVVTAEGSGLPVFAMPVAAVTEGVPMAKAARYKKELKVGVDDLLFVAMGDGKAGYNMDRGNIEPVQGRDEYRKGFYTQGKLAYYLKGKIKGKYIVTSSFDTERQRKAALRTFRSEEYYPVYGDASTVNYDATDTEGPLYLSVEWDKSQAIWGNYAVAFNNTEFANYTRSLYGGKLDYRTVASTEYGEAKTNVALFHAQVQQRSAHNELLGTGGSLYYLKNNDIVQGTDRIRVEVRDAVTGLVKSRAEMKEGVDYNMDYSNGRILFWKPVSMSMSGSSIISDTTLSGDPVYVVADYEYFVHDQLAEATRGARVSQAVGKSAVVGATYVSETQADRNYELKGADVVVHMGRDATVQAEYAETSSSAQNNYISTDGGITFTELATADTARGKAYGIRQDARLFDRVGLKSYYKWIGDGFSTAGTASQQGKELKGFAMTFDLTPVTRLTASRDIQRLIEGGNLQTSMQVGGQETTTTLVQVVHDARRLRLTESFQSVEVKGATGTSTRKTNALTAAAQAEYALNAKTDLLLKHQAALSGVMDQLTTVGVRRQLTDRLSINVEESFGSAGTATKVGATANVTPQLALNTDYSIGRATSGAMTQTVTLGGKGQINDKTSLDATVGVNQDGQRTGSVAGTRKVSDKTALQAVASATQSASGMQETAVTLGGTTKVDEDTDVKIGLESTQASDASRSREALVLDGARKGLNGRETTGGVRIEDRAADGKMTVITAGEKGQMTPVSQLATERSFAFGPKSQEEADAYKITRVKDGRTMETSYARKISDQQVGRSDSNIFGLSGDINDRLAFQAAFEKGKAFNLDGSVYDRIALTGGVGYVEKDAETGNTLLQSSTKAEVRFDQGATDRQQYVLYQSTEGKLNDQTTVRGKFNYSLTRNMTTKKAEASYKEIMLGAAYRPVASDRMNIFGQYTYKENKGPVGQTTATDIEQTKMHVLTAGVSYELNEKWELVEKLALRIMEEKVSGFEFAKTHTWLVVNRANYTLNQDWKIGAEYRILTVKEAGDRKSGMLVEAVHSINDHVEMGIGYNFTNFVDDLTDLGYTVQGPYIRMTGKLYDQSPAERARAKAKWMERRIELYAWKMVRKEFSRRDSPIVLELNQMYQMATIANDLGKYEDSRRIYKDIILVTQMMYEEAAQFVRQHIDFEERVFNAYQRAQEYFDKGELWQARKLWEKIVEEASRAVLE